VLTDDGLKIDAHNRASIGLNLRSFVVKYLVHLSVTNDLSIVKILLDSQHRRHVSSKIHGVCASGLYMHCGMAIVVSLVEVATAVQPPILTRNPLSMSQQLIDIECSFRIDTVRIR
jgi:hypothetical protein